MKLLFVSRFFGKGGAERTLIPLAQYLAQQDYQLTLFQTVQPEYQEIFNQFPGQVILPSTSSNLVQNYWQLNREIAQADLVIATSELTPTYLTWLLCQWNRKPLVADVQVCLSQWVQDNCSAYHQFLCGWIYPQIPYLRCVSQGVAQDLQTYYQIPARKCSVIYVPFDLEAIAQASQQPIPARDQAIFHRPTIVASGRLTSQKRFDIAIEAYHRLYHNYQINANLLILGEGELRPQLERQVADLGLKERVFLPGFVENPHAYVKQAQVFLLSSDYEGFGRVILEALAVGCPCVATDCPSGPAEILEGGKYGLLTPMQDPDAIAAALVQVLTNSQLAEQFQKTGPQRAQAFDATNINQQYERLIQTAIAESLAQ